MVRNVQLRLTLKEEATPNGLEIRTAKYLGLADGTFKIKVLRKSIDARKPKIVFNYKLAVYINEPAPSNEIAFKTHSYYRFRTCRNVGGTSLFRNGV